MSRLIYIVGSGFNDYSNWMEGIITNKFEEADLIVFCGGSDVDPSIYNEPKGKYTYTDLGRDKRELLLFNKAKELNKHCIGICRGNQLLCALQNKGRLVQHQENPSFIHEIKTYDGKRLLASSTHHQAAFPYDIDLDDYKLLAWTEGISKFHLDGNNEEISKNAFYNEAEIVYYPKTKCLGIQMHPEMLFSDKKYEETITYLRDLLDKFLKNEL